MTSSANGRRNGWNFQSILQSAVVLLLAALVIGGLEFRGAFSEVQTQVETLVEQGKDFHDRLLWLERRPTAPGEPR